ncbi:hypothetical protein KP509_23G018600 [Ceratopteris richardii]|uniref:GAGA-binding transcriptional activator n=1 Tax=Ceratopteris richardii TaxID=49495 RepID=A0A8T2S0L7_CERRI|nr:hypothetical protein KP509_23G018600 [Ceratopteris richardii]KAH7301278.1 hypothetical protein KP509_23G018600 [Ceratopteris richardii]KAH7301281.1 hypothetical protein KP509_23G018600 [Ceratopteris richardii]
MGMDDFSKMEHRHWSHFDQSHMKDYLKDHPALKLIDVIAQRDAAIAERDTAMAEKKTAFAERDAALLQRDVAYADRNTAWIERDTALAALAMLRSSKDNSEAAAKLMHTVNINMNGPFIEPISTMQPGEGPPMVVGFGDASGGKKQQTRKPQDGANRYKRKPKANSQPRCRGSNFAIEADMQAQTPSDALVMFKGADNQGEVSQTGYDDVVPCNLTLSTPIPYCSCTGSHQQCYRWGNGGWQSACCTNVLSMYPLPMRPTKRGVRIPGRKISGNAFRKVLHKLATEGYNTSLPIDLKNHWAKHGTNRYVTIK